MNPKIDCLGIGIDHNVEVLCWPNCNSKQQFEFIGSEAGGTLPPTRYHWTSNPASELGHQLVPASVAAIPKRVFRRRWDQFEIPRIFARVWLVIGEPLSIPPELPQEHYREWAQRIHHALESLRQKAVLLVDPGVSRQTFGNGED